MLKNINQNGFTLVELMLTLAIAAVLLAVAVPSFNTLVNNGQLESAAGDIVSVLKGAREKAVTLGEGVSITQDVDSIECSFTDATVADVCPSYQINYDAITVSSNNSFRFGPSGMLETGGVTFTVNHSEISAYGYEINILSSGRISIRQVNI